MGLCHFFHHRKSLNRINFVCYFITIICHDPKKAPRKYVKYSKCKYMQTKIKYAVVSTGAGKDYNM